MDYRIVLASRAVSDLEDIVRYIALHNPEAARKLGQKLLNKTKELSQFAMKGQKVPEFNESLNLSKVPNHEYSAIWCDRHI